jgi:hypothetical protein
VGTFHQGKHELHGITVVVDTVGPEVFIGRCDDIDELHVVLHDADAHRAEQGAPTKDEWIARAVGCGVWPRHRRLVVPRQRVASIRRLGEL